MNAIERAELLQEHRVSPAARWIVRGRRDGAIRFTEPLDEVSARNVELVWQGLGLDTEWRLATRREQAEIETLLHANLLQAGFMVLASCTCGMSPGTPQALRGEVILIASTPGQAPLKGAVGVTSDGEPTPIVGGFPLLDAEPPASFVPLDRGHEQEHWQTVSDALAKLPVLPKKPGDVGTLAAPAPGAMLAPTAADVHPWSAVAPRPPLTGPVALGLLWGALVALGQVVLLALLPALAIPQGKERP